MAPIANLTRITVIGTFVDLDGDPITGRITFSPSFDVLCDPDENVIVDNIPLSVDLDEDGSFSIVLPVADDPDITPQGWTYQVSEPTGRSYPIVLSSDVPGGVLDLVDAVPSGVANPGVAILARRIRDSQDYSEPNGAPQAGQVLTWDTTTSTYQPQAPAVYTAENARDDVGAALTEGSSAIDIVLDDAANTITITPVTGSTSGTLAAGNDARITGSVQKVDNLGDLLDASVARTNLGLGNAATRGVGTTSSDVAAGNDSRITGALQAASNLSDLASATTARTNLGLDTAATLAVGTTTGTVAAGDDSRIVGAAQKASNLSDLANAATARTNLGLGAAAVKGVGTSSSDVAAGDDTRITGAAAKASNLSDLASISTARTNLGLGGAALLAVGTTTGTVAAGDDPRLGRRVVAMTDGATITPDCDTTDVGKVTLGGNRTMAAPSGTPVAGQKLILRLKQDGTGSRTITWNSVYRFAAATAPTLTTTAAKTDYVGFIYNADDSKWDGVAFKANF